jgi:mRNA-degrading endonuclease RelE of RelBE toxin-antitoxin system
MYQVIVEKRALKELLQIPRNYAKAIRTAIDDLASDPHPYGSIKLTHIAAKTPIFIKFRMFFEG